MKTVFSLFCLLILVFALGCTQAPEQKDNTENQTNTVTDNTSAPPYVPLTDEEIEDFKEEYGDQLPEDFDWESAR